MGAVTYRHQPLRTPRATRLVELEQSNDFNAPIRCKLQEVSLDNCPPYEALSYSWDAQIPTRQVFCFNQSWTITENCETALRYLRLPNHSRLLWIDSICIDQSSIPERNQQVSVMEEIYWRAVEIIVWLGTETKVSNIAMSNLIRQSQNPDWTNIGLGTHGGSIVRSAMYGGFLMPLVYCILRPLALFRGIGSSKKHSSPINVDGYGGMYFDLFGRSVFERMWCIQEIVVARQVRLICGRLTITWDEIVAAIESLGRLLSLVTKTKTMVRFFQERLALQKELREIVRPSALPYDRNVRTWPTLTTLITCTRNRGASDPRDKVFAIAGLLRYMGIGLAPSDYSKSTRHVYLEITQAAIRQFGTLDILYQVTGLENQFDLPSWVPDLSDTHPPKPMIHGAFNATGSSPSYYYRFSDSAPSLTLWGKIIGQIHHCGEPNLLSAHSNLKESTPSLVTELDSVLRIFQQWSTIAHSLPSYPNQQTLSEVFARTLFINGTSLESGDPSSLLAVFPTWHTLMTSAASSHALRDEVLENMLVDLRSIPINAQEKREFALQMITASLEMGIQTKVSKTKRAKVLHFWLAITTRRMVFFTTESGYMGISTYGAQANDFVALLAGLNTPFIMRRKNDGYQLVGPAYVHGAMKGEVWDPQAQLDEFLFI